MIAHTPRVLLWADVCSHDVINASVTLPFGSGRRIPWPSLGAFDQTVH